MFSEEAKLIEECIKGSRKAQKELYDKYNALFFSLCLRYTHTREEAEDILQEGFIKAFRRIHEFEGRSGFGHWLKTIVINTSIDRFRKRRRLMEAELSEENIVEEGDDWHDGADEEDMAIQAEQIRKAILQLPEGYRVVVSLHLLEGYDHEEIGQILGISNSTARSQFARGRKKLIEILKRQRK